MSRSCPKTTKVQAICTTLVWSCISGKVIFRAFPQQCEQCVVHSRMWFSLQNVYYTSTHQLHIGLLSPTVDDDDNKCLVDVNGRPRLIECSYATVKRMKLHWVFTQVYVTNMHVEKLLACLPIRKCRQAGTSLSPATHFDMKGRSSAVSLHLF